jgi:hypothetical protein
MADHTIAHLVVVLVEHIHVQVVVQMIFVTVVLIVIMNLMFVIAPM